MSDPHGALPYGALPYGRLHRDVFKIAIEENFSKLEMRFYSYIIVNCNPFSGEFYSNMSVQEAAKLLKFSKREVHYCLKKFHNVGIYVREKGIYGMKGNAPHVPRAVKDANVQREQKKDPYLIDPPRHPFANKVFGILPREFVRVAVEEKLGKFAQRHFWYITLNLSLEGHLTRLEEIEDIGTTIGTDSMLTMLRSFKTLQKTGLFKVKRPSTIQGVAEPVVAAIAEAEAARQQKAYEKAEREFLKNQRSFAKWKFKRTMSDEEVKSMRRIFREHFEDTGKFLCKEEVI